MSSDTHLSRLAIITILCMSIKCYAGLENSLHAVLTSIKCTNLNRTLMKHLNCDLTPDSRGLPMWNLNFSLSHDVSELRLLFKLHVERAGKYNTIFSVDIDYCREWASLKNNMMVRFIVNELSRVSNMGCPFKKNVLYYVRNFNATVFAVPKYMPRLNFMIFAEYRTHNKSINNFRHFGKLLHITKENLKEVLADLKVEND